MCAVAINGVNLEIRGRICDQTSRPCEAAQLGKFRESLLVFLTNMLWNPAVAEVSLSGFPCLHTVIEGHMKTHSIALRGILYLILATASFSVKGQLSFGWLSNDQITDTPLGGNDRSSVVLIHGWTGAEPQNAPPDAYTGDWSQLNSALETRLASSGWKLLQYHWEQDASTGPAIDFDSNETGFSNARNAASHAFYNGAHLATLLHDKCPQLRRIVLVAHSAGSWAAYRAADHLLQANPYVVVNIVLLDPFIPGVDPSVISPLNTSTMGLIDTHPSADRIYRLENYFAIDYTDIDFDFGSGGGSRATSQTFSWRGRDINHRVDYAPNPIVHPGNYYGVEPSDLIGHAGPLRFYADSVLASDGPPIPNGLALAPWDFTSVGFYRGLVNEGFLLPTINTHPQSQSANSGINVNLNVSAVSSQAISYQWFRNGQQISGANGQSYSFTASAGTAGDYVVRVSNVNGLVFSEKASVTLNAVATPTITSVTPRTLNVLPLPQTQLITITGTGFTGDSRLTFNDGVNPPYVDKVPTFISATELRYNIAVGPNPATWTVKVVNGAVESLPYSFHVVSGTAQLTSLGVSGPAAIAENGSGQFTATAYFSDGSLLNVTATASWSENSSATTVASGLLSAGSVGSDTTVTVSASYTAGGITKSASASVTIVNSANCGSTDSERILNGNFAGNGANWALTGNFFANATFSVCNSCPGYAWFANADGTGGNNLSGTLSQSITIPANATSATLGYWHRITTTETGSAFDFLTLNLVLPGGTLVGLDQRSNLHATGNYAYRSFDILAYKGQTITVRFTATTDGSFPTVFRVDDVSVSVTVPNPITPVLFGITGPTNVAEGNTAQFSAIVVNCDGSIQPVSASWSENSGATTISGSGLLTAGGVSSDTTVTVTATYAGFGSLNRSITVVNSAASFSYLAISGPSSINESSSGQFTASAILSDGSSQSVSPSWSENSGATTISGSGLLSAGGVGSDTTVTVSATHTINGVTRDANQDVLIVNIPPPVTLSSLSITGPSSVDEHTAAQYSATALFSDGSSQSVNPTWSENSGAASISSFGLLSAGEVASDLPMTVSASYTFNAVTRNASTNLVVKDVLQPTSLVFASVGNRIVLSWPTNSAGFVLEYTTNLPPTLWVTNATPPVIENSRHTVTNAVEGQKRFYRLRR